MFKHLKRLMSRSKTVNMSMGPVLFSTPVLSGQSSHSHFQWRVKKGLDDEIFFFSLKFRADYYGGMDGAENYFINFDLETAERVRDQLDSCIAYYERARQEKKREIPLGREGGSKP